MSLLPTIGVYGSVCKHLGIEMRFPGTKIAYTSPMEVCDAHVLAEEVPVLRPPPWGYIPMGAGVASIR